MFLRIQDPKILVFSRSGHKTDWENFSWKSSLPGKGFLGGKILAHERYFGWSHLEFAINARSEKFGNSERCNHVNLIFLEKYCITLYNKLYYYAIIAEKSKTCLQYLISSFDSCSV
jgi:hypothetical protein